MGKRKIISEPSEEFLEAICHSGSLVIDCEFCGRTHFGNKEPGMDWERGEFERLMKKSRENPDKYVFHANNDTVHWGTLDGKNYVLDCPCNSALRYEALFWNSRGVIASYFSKRAKRQLNAAQEDSRLADSVSTNIEKSR